MRKKKKNKNKIIIKERKAENPGVSINSGFVGYSFALGGYGIKNLQ